MKKYLKFAIILLSAVIFVFGYSLTKPQREDSQGKNTQATAKAEATLKINVNEEEKTIDISKYVGMTLLDSMQDAGIRIEKSGEGEMTFITAIEGRKADSQKREFWEFVVNGSPAPVGAGSYAIQNNDKIEWKISNY